MDNDLILYQFSRTGGELLSENDLHKGQTADYIYLNGRPVGEVNPTTGKLYFSHTERLGTPEKLTDSTQAIVWSATYKPFGNTVLFGGTLTNQNLRLPGQYFDPETGNNHNGFRHYSGAMTRYVESDPIGLAGGMNTYQYVGENPFKWTDRSGLNPGSDSGQAYPSITEGGSLCIPASSGPMATGGCAAPPEPDLWQRLMQTLAICAQAGALPPPTGPEDVIVGTMGASGGPPATPLALPNYMNTQINTVPTISNQCTFADPNCVPRNIPPPGPDQMPPYHPE